VCDGVGSRTGKGHSGGGIEQKPCPPAEQEEQQRDQVRESFHTVLHGRLIHDTRCDGSGSCVCRRERGTPRGLPARLKHGGPGDSWEKCDAVAVYTAARYIGRSRWAASRPGREDTLEHASRSGRGLGEQSRESSAAEEEVVSTSVLSLREPIRFEICWSDNMISRTLPHSEDIIETFRDSPPGNHRFHVIHRWKDPEVPSGRRKSAPPPTM
jgi:hypothetical protein